MYEFSLFLSLSLRELLSLRDWERKLSTFFLESATNLCQRPGHWVATIYSVVVDLDRGSRFTSNQVFLLLHGSRITLRLALQRISTCRGSFSQRARCLFLPFGLVLDRVVFCLFVAVDVGGVRGFWCWCWCWFCVGGVVVPVWCLFNWHFLVFQTKTFMIQISI